MKLLTKKWCNHIIITIKITITQIEITTTCVIFYSFQFYIRIKLRKCVEGMDVGVDVGVGLDWIRRYVDDRGSYFMTCFTLGIFSKTTLLYYFQY